MSLFSAAHKVANQSIRDVFDDPVLYTRYNGDGELVSTREIRAIWHEKYKEVTLGQESLPIMSTSPVFDIRVSDLNGMSPQQGDILTREDGFSYEVIRIEPDGRGSAKLFVAEVDHE